MIYRKHFTKFSIITSIFFLIILLSTLVYLNLYDTYLSYQSNLELLYGNINETNLLILKIDNRSFENIVYYYLIYLNFGSILFFLHSTILAVKTISFDNNAEKIFITAPIKKETFLKNKIILAIINIFILHILNYLVLIIYFSINKASNFYLGLLLIEIAIFLSSLAIYSIILAIVSFIKKRSYILATALTILFCFIILSLIYKITNFFVLSYINPLCYFNYIDILDNHELNLEYIICVLVILIFGFNISIYREEV